MIGTILLFLVLLSVLVIAHEFGHFLAARKSGMKVEEFGLGFPPRLFSWKGKDGMVWSINAIPLGGFVKIKGEGGEDADRLAPDSFAAQSKLKRFIVLIAGVAMNLVAAAAIFTIGFGIGMPTVIEGGVEGAKIKDPMLHIVEVVPESPAAAAGIQVGDRLLSIDGAEFTESAPARSALGTEEGTTHAVVIARGEEVQTVTLAPEYIEEIGRSGVGMAIVQTGTVSFPWYIAPIKGIEATVASTWQIVSAFGSLIGNLITRTPVAAELAGPVGIAVITGEVAKLGFAHLLQFAAMLSINLAVINILPIPALDGGRIAFLVLEVIRRKPASPRLEQAVHAVGFAILMLLVLVVTFKDIAGLVS